MPLTPATSTVYTPDFEELERLVDEGYINRQKHPTEDLFIWNYSKKTQYDQEWNEDTVNCRGLITDSEGQVRARPFKKFFNYEQLDPSQIPNEPFEVYDKMDGSLGIMYFVDGEPFIATRGSFDSEQAKEANKILREKYSQVNFEPSYTYLCEIIFPANRIVVDYGKTRDLVFLAVVETESGLELSRQHLARRGLTVAAQYDGVSDFRKLKEVAKDNSEGFVVRFASGFRMKLKFAEYLRLHKILTGVSNKLIWEFLRDGKPLDEILERVPDEFYAYVKNTEEILRNEYRNVEATCRDDIETLPDPETTPRREVAEYVKKFDYPSIVFSMLDHKDYSQAVWKLVRPQYAKPFAVDVDE